MRQSSAAILAANGGRLEAGATRQRNEMSSWQIVKCRNS
jgi:hypothetical protein